MIPAPDFTLVDQYGEEHTLSDYEGKTVFLNLGDLVRSLQARDAGGGTTREM